MSKIWLVTGATGFVGRHVIHAIATRDIRLKVVIRGEACAESQWPEGTVIIQSEDMFSESASWWKTLVQGVDTVVHLAWYAEPGKYLQSPKNWDCLSGTLALAKACLQAGVRRFIGIGTCLEYDVTAGYLSVQTPLNPLSPYAAAKVSCYFALRSFFNQTGTSFVWCRLFNLYGDGEDPRRLIAYVKSQLQKGLPVELTSGQQVRDYMDVREAAENIVITALGQASGPVNICSSKAVTVKELVTGIALKYGRPDLLRFGARLDNPTEPLTIVGIKD